MGEPLQLHFRPRPEEGGLSAISGGNDEAKLEDKLVNLDKLKFG